jgi:hypothetical protein
MSRWSELEIDFLRTNFMSMSDEKLADCLPGRTKDAVYKQLRSLGFKRPKEVSIQLGMGSHGNFGLRPPKLEPYIPKATNGSKLKAKGRVSYATGRGYLESQSCIICGDLISEGHHEDYNKPLEVIWLCHSHHMGLHALKRVGLDTNRALIAMGIITSVTIQEGS